MPDKIQVTQKTKEFSIAMDTASPCNARCVFCFNDWAKIPANIMSPDTFAKIIPLIGMVQDNGFYLSCLFEPTLNPKFTEILSMLPEEGKKKIFFTTNLVRKLSDEELIAFCQTNTNHINISLETYQDALYRELTNTTNSYFYDNLKRLGAFAQQYHKDIRLITMILKSNYQELPSLVKKAHDEINPKEHELRTPYFVKASKEQMERVEQEILPRNEIDHVMDQILAMNYVNIVYDTTNDDSTYQRDKEEYENTNTSSYSKHFYEDYIVRIEPSGLLHFEEQEYDVRQIEDIRKFMREKIVYYEQMETEALYHRQQLVKVKSSFLQSMQSKEQYHVAASNEDLEIINRNAKMFNYIDKAELYDNKILILIGWAALEKANTDQYKERFMIVENKNKNVIEKYQVKMISRPDVAKVLDISSATDAGFECMIDLTDLGSPEELEFYLGYRKNNIAEMTALNIQCECAE